MELDDLQKRNSLELANLKTNQPGCWDQIKACHKLRFDEVDELLGELAYLEKQGVRSARFDELAAAGMDYWGMRVAGMAQSEPQAGVRHDPVEEDCNAAIVWSHKYTAALLNCRDRRARVLLEHMYKIQLARLKA